jgi:hypothetical protein
VCERGARRVEVFTRCKIKVPAPRHKGNLGQSEGEEGNLVLLALGTILYFTPKPLEPQNPKTPEL